MEPAEDDVRADRDLEPVRLELDALLLGAARAGGDDREQVIAHDRHAVERDLVPVLEALELDVMDAEALLAVEEVGQAVPEHRHLPGDRAIAGEADEIDGLHGPTLARGAYGPRYGTFVPAGDGLAVTR